MDEVVTESKVINHVVVNRLKNLLFLKIFFVIVGALTPIIPILADSAIVRNSFQYITIIMEIFVFLCLSKTEYGESGFNTAYVVTVIEFILSLLFNLFFGDKYKIEFKYSRFVITFLLILALVIVQFIKYTCCNKSLAAISEYCGDKSDKLKRSYKFLNVYYILFSIATLFLEVMSKVLGFSELWLCLLFLPGLIERILWFRNAFIILKNIEADACESRHICVKNVVLPTVIIITLFLLGLCDERIKQNLTQRMYKDIIQKNYLSVGSPSDFQEIANGILPVFSSLDEVFAHDRSKTNNKIGYIAINPAETQICKSELPIYVWTPLGTNSSFSVTVVNRHISSDSEWLNKYGQHLYLYVVTLRSGEKLGVVMMDYAYNAEKDLANDSEMLIPIELIDKQESLKHRQYPFDECNALGAESSHLAFSFQNESYYYGRLDKMERNYASCLSLISIAVAYVFGRIIFVISRLMEKRPFERLEHSNQ